MAVYRSAHGKPVDMSALAAKNEKVRAVGNMNVNARGDVIDNNNNVIRDNTKRVKSNYNNAVGKNPTLGKAKQTAKPPAKVVEELSKHEQESFDDFDNEEDIKK